MPETNVPTGDVEQDYLRHDAAALGSISSSYDGTDMRTQELFAQRAVAQANLAQAAALVLIANAIREGWQDEPEEPDDADVVNLRLARRDGIPDPDAVTGWKPGHSPGSLGDQR